MTDTTPTPPIPPEHEVDGPRLRVLVVDDHDVVHWGLRVMLGRQPWVRACLHARDGADAVEIARRRTPHVALVDLFIGDESGPEICGRILAVSPGTRVAFISGAGRISAAAARAAGARGFIPKDWPAERVARAVRLLGAGRVVFPEAPEPTPTTLTPRERDVLELIATGATNPEIGQRLGLSAHTVKEYASAVYRKLEVRNRAEAVQRAQKLGLVE
jgi:DNA-binding NarL/FixJ family response regulator